MRRTKPEAPPARVTLRAYLPAPARVELVYQPMAARLARTLACLLGFWGAIPLLLWVPPHYPWVVGCLAAGAYLAYRQWTGRYHVRAFAGICPRCGHPLSLGLDHAISLPHTLTCFNCHFEPQLEVEFETAADPGERGPLEHRAAECTGAWRERWLADEAYLVCDRCFAHRPATASTRRAAEAENACARLLEQLSREGGQLL